MRTRNNPNRLIRTTGKVVCGIALTTLFFACGSGNSGQTAQEKLPYPVIQVDTATSTIYADYPAEIQSGTVVEIRPRVSGYINKILVQEGGTVRKGEKLFLIDEADLQATYSAAVANADAARAQMDNAALEVRKLTPLVEKGIISPYELDNANSSLQAARANLAYAQSQARNAEVNLGYATIASPVSGVVGRIVVREGTLVGPTNTNPLTAVSAFGNMSAYFAVNERTLMNLLGLIPGNDLGTKVAKMPPLKLVTADGVVYGYDGKAEVASALVDATTGSMQLKAVFPNPDGILRTGSSGTVRIPATLKDKVIIPQKSTYELQDKTMVYVVDSAGTIHSKNVIKIGTSGAFFVISTGLNPGDKILYEGLTKVRDGQQITPQVLRADSVYKALRNEAAAVKTI